MAATTGVSVNTQDEFVPEIWATHVLLNLDNESLMMDKVDRSFEQFVQGTDKVRIPVLGEITVTRDSSADAIYDDDNPTLSNPTDAKVELNLNETSKVGFTIQDTARMQSPYDLAGMYGSRMGTKLAADFDDYLLAKIGSAKHVTTNHNSSAELTQADFIKVLVQFKKDFAPENERYIVLSPNMMGQIMGIAKFTDRDFTGNIGSISTPMNYAVGMVYNIPVFVSNHTDKVTGGRTADTSTTPNTGAIAANAERSVAFQKEFLAFAMQKGFAVEQVRMENNFADIYRAQVVYGSVEVRPAFAQVLADVP